jgi:hypothetical protein
MGASGRLSSLGKRVFRSRIDLLLFSTALFAPFMVGYQVLEWSWSGSSYVGLVIYSRTWMLVAIGSLDMPLNEFDFFFGCAQIILALLLGLAFAIAVKSGKSSKRWLATAQTLCVLNIMFDFLVALLETSLSSFTHMISPPGVDIMPAPGITSAFTVYFPFPGLIVLGLYLLRQQHQKLAETG